jgi:exodeoxyribonuclease VII large subunit
VTPGLPFPPPEPLRRDRKPIAADQPVAHAPPDEKRGAQTPPSSRPVLTVAQLTRQIKGALESTFGHVWVTGEISNLSRPSSGHIYFTLKDREAQINVALFRNVAQRVRILLTDGLEIVLYGRLTVYEPRGQYQIIAERVEPKGLGALELAFRRLREKLEREGLFDPARKRPLPFLPRRIGLVTSPTGAAIRDILTTIVQRFPRANLLLAPVRVQGQGAAEEIARAIATLNQVPDIDVLIVGRGGGSLEDLWAFNEEVVARAIYASRAPVISAVGHEIDFTIADFVADRRALTPTDAGQIVLPRWQDLVEDLEERRLRLARGLRRALDLARSRMDLAARGLAALQPIHQIRLHQQHLDDLAQRAAVAMAHTLATARQRLAAAQGQLDTLSPLAVLNRGYSITTADDRILTDARDAPPGTRITTRLARGRLDSTVSQTQSGD